MRLPSTFVDASGSFIFLRTTPARKPRTECCCQPVVCIIAAIVVPDGDRSIAMTRACLEDAAFPFPVVVWMRATFVGFLVVARANLALHERLFADFLTGFGIGISIRLIAACRRTTEAPPRLISRRGASRYTLMAPELDVLPLQSAKKASPFWITFLLTWPQWGR